MAQTMLYLAQAPRESHQKTFDRVVTHLQKMPSPFLGELDEDDIPTKTHIKPYATSDVYLHGITKVSVGSMVYYTVAIILAILLGFEIGFVGRLLGF